MTTRSGLRKQMSEGYMLSRDVCVDASHPGEIQIRPLTVWCITQPTLPTLPVPCSVLHTLSPPNRLETVHLGYLTRPCRHCPGCMGLMNPSDGTKTSLHMGATASATASATFRSEPLSGGCSRGKSPRVGWRKANNPALISVISR
jgi:hypothetical protein